ncbi:MAG: cyclodeaminase/cyclohydrolase family protein, partial [Acutalibacteraceae bacterium]
LIDADAQAFQPLSRAYSMPKDAPCRDEIMEKCLYDAALAPMETLGLCARAIELAERFAEIGSTLAVSDAGCAAVFCRAALEGAALNVFVNTRFMKDREKAQAMNREVNAYLEKYAPMAEQTYTQVKGEVTLDEVDFGYVPEKDVLHDVSVYAKPGQKVAFVGSTGAGKTTITNLINRFYDIADGKIRYDGININKIKKADLRRSLGVVLQDVNLFTGTVMDNIRYGKPDATDEECIAAAKLANAHGFIEMLPDGYYTELSGNGAGLSQGQRQLISIARAAVADPPVMILDEATSSIDTRTEAIVQKGMDSLMRGRTVFVIAHRLSTVRNSDVIMVLEHGRIIERGDHDALIAKRGKYYQLYTGAFELE